MAGVVREHTLAKGARFALQGTPMAVEARPNAYGRISGHRFPVSPREQGTVKILLLPVRNIETKRNAAEISNVS